MAVFQPDYLGDGAYASFDGYQYRLYTSDGAHITNEIFLDPQTLEAFDRYRARINEQCERIIKANAEAADGKET